MKTFYMGAKPHLMAHTDVPLFVANPHLKDMRKLPRARGPWALDSGGFTQLSETGSWESGPTPREYVEQIRRYRDEIGNLAWAAPQDWMCEDAIIHGGQVGRQVFPGTHLSVKEHLHRTVGNYLDLKSLDDSLNIIPVVQGNRPAAYEYCITLYDRAGVDLTRQPVVGIGSVCRIQATDDAVEIIEHVVSIVGTDRLHGFGFKILGLERVGHLLGTADSHAWSLQGRNTPSPDCDFRLPRSRGPHKNEANCLRYALRWRERVLAAIEAGATAPRQLSLDLAAA
ncbi:hypothetical protein ACIG0A_33425 [Streptomyces californicus]|uniref:deazapurine DNA modification protein DpdA family protein n=1 Tax=Streptomyces californicus TaxID=67351 RepID=UPI0037D4E10E